MHNLPSIEHVAHAFSKAATTYDAAATLQVQVADALAQRFMPVSHGRVLDFGCGTGYLCQKLQQNTHVKHITGVDIAPAMLEIAQQKWQHTHTPNTQWLLTDGQTMNLQPDAFDMVVSSLAIQWCRDLRGLFANIAQGLKPNGHLFMATLGPHSMHELRTAWQQVDDFQHVNEFVANAELIQELSPHFEQIVIHQETIQLTFATVTQLVKNLKQLGVSNHTQGARRGLTTVRQFRAMQMAYEAWRDEQGLLPLTYEVFYIEAKKRGHI